MTTLDTRTDITEAIEALRFGGHDTIVATARQLAADLATRAAAYDRSGEFPAQSIDALWAAGFGALTIPVDRGGVGAPLTTVVAAVEILSAADSATTLVFVWNLLTHRMINAPGSVWPEHWVERVTRDALEAPALLNYLNVEPDLGSSARGGRPATTATRVTLADGSPGWRIDGHKIYSTGSHGLKWMAVTASTAEDDLDGLRVGTFLVPGEADGVEIVETWDHLGMRASASHDVIFTDVVIPLDHTVGLAPYTGGPPAFTGDDPGGYLASLNALILSVYIGVANASRDWLVRYLNERTPTNLGAPLSSLPRFQQAVGEIEALNFTNEQLVHGLAATFDSPTDGGFTPSHSSLIKVIVARNVIRSTELAVSLVGNPGLSRNNPLERHYRDALCSRVHTPQEDLVLTDAGKLALGLSPASAIFSGRAAEK